MMESRSRLGLSMEQTRSLLKRMVDGENRLIADLLVNNPIQLMDVMICASSMIEWIRKLHPDTVDAMFAKELPD